MKLRSPRAVNLPLDDTCQPDTAISCVLIISMPIVGMIEKRCYLCNTLTVVISWSARCISKL